MLKNLWNCEFKFLVAVPGGKEEEAWQLAPRL